jgi:signal transduction histidine kinase
MELKYEGWYKSWPRVKMKLTLFRRMCATLVAILLLAVISSGVGLFSAWRSVQQFRLLARQNLQQAGAIHEMEIALLEQGFSTSLYLMGGKVEWLDELRRKRPDFDLWLGETRKMGPEPDEQELINQISKAFAEYDGKSREVIAVYAGQDPDQARRLWLAETVTYYDRVYELCESLSKVNTRDVERAIAAQSVQMKRVNLWVIVFLCVLTGLILGLAVSLSHGVFRPLRHLADSLGKEPAIQGRPVCSLQEIQSLGSYIDKLRQQVAEVSSHLSQSQERLLDAQKLASVGKLAASVAHEIRSPLTSLKLRIFSMQRALGDAYGQTDFQLISEEISRLDGIVRDFLEFAKPHKLVLQRCDIRLLLDKTLEMLAYKLEATGVAVQHEGGDTLPQVVADPQQLKQVLVNVLNNAIEALHAGGAIHIVTRTDDGHDGQKIVRILVRDNGPGIPYEVQDNIFEPFFGTKAEGTGLGLWIARRIMTEHGGGIDLEQSTPAGTTFSLWLPATAGSGDEQDTRS